MVGNDGLKPPLHKSSSPQDREPNSLDRLAKWQEERIARRLKGEHESSVLHLSELIQSNLHTTMNISSVCVHGADKTRATFIDYILHPILMPSLRAEDENHPPSDLHSVLHTTRRVADIFDKTGIFRSVDARIERAKDSLASDTDVDLVFTAREKGRYYLNTSTELGNEEGSAMANACIRNVFGGAEMLEVHAGFGTKTRRTFRVAFTTPLSPDLDTNAEILLFGVERDAHSYASCTERLRGIRAAIRSGTPERGSHEWTYEVGLRGVLELGTTASISVREAAGQTSKSSISHTYLLDTRNDKAAPTCGYSAKVFNEFAGIGGDASFWKSELEGHAAMPAFWGTSFSLSARTGLLWGIGKPTLFIDRFQLGGPTSVRAFKPNGLGPRDGADSLGGDLYWSGGASIITNIPRKPDWPLKMHFWVNAGRMDAINKCRPLMKNIQATVTHPSVSTGVGLIYRFHPVRIEVNMGVPIIASKSDGIRRGLQVGVGLEFL